MVGVKFTLSARMRPQATLTCGRTTDVNGSRAPYDIHEAGYRQPQQRRRYQTGECREPREVK